jgi:hypothetical protein
MCGRYISIRIAALREHLHSVQKSLLSRGGPMSREIKTRKPSEVLGWLTSVGPQDLKKESAVSKPETKPKPKDQTPSK